MKAALQFAQEEKWRRVDIASLDQIEREYSGREIGKDLTAT